MIKTNIGYEKTGYFSKIIIDYLGNEKDLQLFYDLPNQLESYSERIKKKQTEKTDRHALAEALQKQYTGTKEIPSNIDLLKQPNTFTITTGHQLCIFTGPLYFIYKIVNAIKLAQTLKQHFPAYHFVPVYWMASEDHDFAEVNHVSIGNKKIKWETHQTGAVGEMDVKGLELCIAEIEGLLGINKNTSVTIAALKNAYLKSKNLAEATRKFVHHLFGKYGLVVVDGNDRTLKSLFSSTIKDEILNGVSYDIVNKTNNALEKKYKIQVNPREINFFYLYDKIRERIVKKEGDIFEVLNTNFTFTKEEIIKEIENFPERFSPNVIMRPLYQETILPNLAYIGGGGEIAYWLQLKSLFGYFKISFPILVLRNSALLVEEKIARKINSLSLEYADLFLGKNVMLNKLVKEKMGAENLLENEKVELDNLMKKIVEKAKNVDYTLIKSAEGMGKRQIAMLNKMNDKLLKGSRKKEGILDEKLTAIFDQLFPKQALQEREQNFLPFFTQQENFIDLLLENFEMFTKDFHILDLNQKTNHP